MPQVPIWVCVLIAVLAAAVCGAVAFFAGVNHRKREAEAAIGSAEDEAKRIISNAIKTAAAKKKEAVLEGKDERAIDEVVLVAVFLGAACDGQLLRAIEGEARVEAYGHAEAVVSDAEVCRGCRHSNGHAHSSSPHFFST